jgi:hypothetical protein
MTAARPGWTEQGRAAISPRVPSAAAAAEPRRRVMQKRDGDFDDMFDDLPCFRGHA